MLVHRRGRVQVEDGAQDDLAAGGGVAGEPVGQELGGGGAELLDRDRTGVLTVEVLRSQVDEQVHPRPGTRGGCGVGVAVEEVEGVLGVGEDPDCPGSACVDRSGVAEGVQLGGQDGDGLVEREGVGGVERHHHIGGGGVVAVLDPDPASGELVFLISDGAVGVVVQPGFLNQLNGVDLVDLVRCRGDEPVGERDRLGRQVVGLVGDGPGDPDRHHPGPGEVEQAREAVGQLESVGDQLTAGVQGDVQGGGEVGGGELRDQGRTGTGEGGDGLVDAGVAPVRGPLGAGTGVQQGPLDGEFELLDRAFVFLEAGGVDTVDHLSSGEGRGGVHGSNSRRRHRQFR